MQLTIARVADTEPYHDWRGLVLSGARSKVLVLRNKNRTALPGMGPDVSVARRQKADLDNMDGLMSVLAEPAGQCWRQLRVDQELHFASDSTT